MRLVATKSVKENTKLAKPIFNENGQILLHEGVPLTSRMIQRLINIGITFIYIEDELTRDIVMKEVVSEQTKMKALTTIKEEFTSISEDLLSKKSFNRDHLSKNFSGVVRAILDDIKNNQEALAMLTDVYVYDSYIFTHSMNVTIYSLGLAMQLKMTDKQLMEIGIGAMLHDVGKMAIPAEILNKPGRLNDEEFAIVKRHAREGYELLKDLPNISLLTAHCALQHHERLDGSGYPQQLIGDKIHTYAKIIGIADVFDAVTSSRVYRGAMLPHEGLELLYAGAGKLYDNALIEAFRRTVAVYPVGVTVGLSDGKEGIVVKQNNQLSTRPVIRILSENGTPLDKPYDVDLMKQMNVTITECEAIL
ncbi:HD-GYP domain-containing protein [Bacillus sp. FJAT-45350]|uniref:HD-GYP domain-containing protein n=1 Tax=Bacillus sp. FJAT-45350 TaxID=2011014 RepID=UPI000BB9789B|nr:HD-GYP domain-containing protein [Bacillus sp. FJAT-45350]